MKKRMIPENPQWTKADFERARPAREVLPQLFNKKTAAQMLKPVKSSRPAAAGES